MNTSTLPSTWQEALQNHPISSARAFEKQLRAGALRDAEKLRALVGSNYRALLATAEQIIDLNDHTRQAESSIASLSQACNPPNVRTSSEESVTKAKVACQLKLVDQLLRCAVKSVKQGIVLLPSKMIIIARLLLKQLEEAEQMPKTVHWLQDRLRVVRQQVLRSIDVLFVRPTTPLRALTQAIGAYCLATSSSSVDAIKYFQTLRIRRLAQGETDVSGQVSQRRFLNQKCHYLVGSIVAIQALHGRGVIDLLNSLQRQPILADKDLLGLEALQLDLSRILIPTDIFSFTPYFKRVSLTTAEQRRSLQEWVDEAAQHLIHDVQSTIGSCKLLRVLRIRNDVLEVLLPSCISTTLHHAVINLIRRTFSERIIELVNHQARHLQVLSTELHTTQDCTKNESIWSSKFVHHLIAEPTEKALKEIKYQRLGMEDQLKAHLSQLRRFVRRCHLTQEEITRLTKIRWQDKIEETYEEDADQVQHIVSELSKEDPALYLTTFKDALLDQATIFMTSAQSTVRQVVEQDSSTVEIDKITTLLRVLRESQIVLQSLLPTQDFKSLATSTNALYECLAQRTATRFFDTAEAKTRPLTTFVAEDLPTPLTVSVLQQLCTTLIEVGGIDIWTTAAIQKVQQLVLQRSTFSDKKEFYVSSEFDEHYLSAALGQVGTQVTNTTNTTARKAAMYWNRTKLLFGVLNV